MELLNIKCKNHLHVQQKLKGQKFSYVVPPRDDPAYANPSHHTKLLLLINNNTKKLTQ